MQNIAMSYKKINSNAMRIWFDISNSPHVILFHDLIKDLENNGHEIIITTRPLANTIDLLDQKNLFYHVIGEHYGKSLFRKIIGFPIRVLQLVNFLQQKKIDIAIGQSSFHLPLVARILGFPSVYTNDNEHAIGNLIAFFCANRILLPANFKLNRMIDFDWVKSKTVFYPGVKEGIYLWVKYQEIALRRIHASTPQTHIYIRPEPQTAQYYSGALFFLDELILQLQEFYAVTILTRNTDQLIHYTHPMFNHCNVPQKPLVFDDIAVDCSLFIGAGGSMTREFALLGIPTISVYQDKLLAVDNLLLEHDLLFHYPQLTIDQVHTVLDELKNKSSKNEFMEMGRSAYEILRSNIIAYD